MTSNQDVELEAKFLVRDIQAMKQRTLALPAVLVQPRTYEQNLRFDLPNGRLTRDRRVLRLRKDTAARLTYKGPGSLQEGIQERTEIEVVVSDFEATARLIKALGYEVNMIYEKYRAMYAWQGTTICLDEMPFGNFLEIEGNRVEEIQDASSRLGLDWEARIPRSYTALFDISRQKRNLSFRDLTFENYLPVQNPDADLPYPYADK